MIKLFSIRDVKADSFGPLTPFPTTALAKRGLVETMNAMDRNHPMRVYPEDFQLYEIGEFDTSSGSIKSLPVPSFVMSASEAVQIIASRIASVPSEPSLPGVIS